MHRGTLHPDAYAWLRSTLQQSTSAGEFRIALMLLGTDPSKRTTEVLVGYLESGAPAWRRSRVAGKLHGGRKNAPLDRLFEQWDLEGNEDVREAIALSLETHYVFGGGRLSFPLQELANRHGDVDAQLLAACLAPADASHLELFQGLVTHAGNTSRDIEIRVAALGKLGTLAASGNARALATVMTRVTDEAADVRRVAFESISGAIGYLAAGARQSLETKLKAAADRETDPEVVLAIREALTNLARTSGAEDEMRRVWELMQKLRGK
jgi:hypothetical protein